MILEDPDVEAHLGGSGQIHLFLDALDEAKVAVRAAVSILERCLSEFDPERLVLRVSCRTAERQTEFEAWLADRFRASSFKALELCPLRMSDAKEAAEHIDIDAGEFLEGVAKAGVATLAARPLTLSLLLEVYASDGSFPEKLTELYERALLLMVTEPDPERKPWRELSPKTENEISDALAILLREKLAEHRAFINREGQINPVGGSGDRTDLLVQAISDDDSAIAVVIEVKGAWNSNLMTAMVAQLAQKYLKPDLSEDGVYLVLWFSGTSWDAERTSERRRRSRATRTAAAALQGILDKQAIEVSRQFGVAISPLVLDASLPIREPH